MPRRLTTAEFVEKATLLHGGAYTYMRAEYIGTRDPITITCPIHGDFQQTPNKHLTGNGCQKCGWERQVKSRTSSREEFIKKAKLIHGDLPYGYDKVEYTNNLTKVEIVCPEHGSFWQTPANHLTGYGCRLCGRSEIANADLEDRRESFLSIVRDIYPHYSYDAASYVNAYTPIKITCPVHGDFWKTPHKHKNSGQGCPRCSKNVSKPEQEVLEFIKDIYGGVIIDRDRNIIGPLEIDILLPEEKIGIEYCGLYWHSDKFLGRTYHKNKLDAMREVGYDLITIFDNEWMDKKDIVKSRLTHRITRDHTKRLFARSCVCKPIDRSERKDFMEANHIQGDVGSSVSIGLFFNSELVSCMSFSKSRFSTTHDWEMTRMASKIGFSVVGGCSKMYSFFKKHHTGSVVSYCDLRWGTGGVYEKMGFTLSHVSAPNYFYVKNGRKILSRVAFQKHKLKKKLDVFDPALSERENMKANGFLRIYDCGNAVFIDS